MSNDLNDRQLTALGWLFHLAGIVSLVVGGCAYHFIISASITNRQTADAAEIAQLELLLDTEQDTARDFVRLQAELARLEASAEAARQRIPETPQESEFLEQISAAASEKGLHIQSYRRDGVTVLATHSQLQIRLTAAGNYESICGFFEEMAKFRRVATVSEMRLTVPAGSDDYPLDMTLTLYFGATAPQGGKHG